MSEKARQTQPQEAVAEAESRTEPADPDSGADSQASPIDPTLAVEAILLSTDKPVSAGKILEALARAPLTADAPADAAGVADLVDALNERAADQGRSFRAEKVGGGYRAMMAPEVGGVLAAFHGVRQSTRLSRAALETLSVVAYRQPVTRAEIEAIRGVACGEVLRSLMERRFVTIAGRAEELGRPILYGTTREFLDQFGLASTKDLPQPEGAPA